MKDESSSLSTNIISLEALSKKNNISHFLKVVFYEKKYFIARIALFEHHTLIK